MKKALSLIFALALCLSLCACGGGNEDNTDTKESMETTESKLTKEELLATAVRFPAGKFYDTCYNDNFILAKETYVGKTYRRAAIVKEITEEGCYAGGIFIPLEKEIILGLKLNECIEIVFKIDDLVMGKDAEGYDSVEIISDEVYYVGNTSKIPAKVMYVATNGALVTLLEDYDGYACKFVVDLTKEQAEAYSEGDTVFVEGTLVKLGTYETYNYNGAMIQVWYEMKNAVITTS